MRDRARSLAWSAVGALGGATGLALSRCAGGACTACFACAVPGAGLVLLAVLRRRRVTPAAPVGPATAPAEG
jgi:hypothetical protein